MNRKCKPHNKVHRSPCCRCSQRWKSFGSVTKKMRIWCLTVSIPAFQAGCEGSNPFILSTILRCRQVGKARDFDSRKSLPVRPLVRVQPPQPYGEVILMVRNLFAKQAVAGNGVWVRVSPSPPVYLIANIRYVLETQNKRINKGLSGTIQTLCLAEFIPQARQFIGE